MQMQGSEAVWKLVLDAHLHCVYPGQQPIILSWESFSAVMPSLPKMRALDLAGGSKEELVLMYNLGLATVLFTIFSALA